MTPLHPHEEYDEYDDKHDDEHHSGTRALPTGLSLALVPIPSITGEW